MFKRVKGEIVRYTKREIDQALKDEKEKKQRAKDREKDQKSRKEAALKLAKLLDDESVDKYLEIFGVREDA